MNDPPGKLAEESGLPTACYALVVGIFIGGAAVFIAISSIYSGARYACEQKAIEAGVGEYYIDENQTKQFRFISPEKEK